MKDFNRAIKSGNSKLNKACGIFNISCIYNCSYCYMTKMTKVYPNIKESWERNKELSMSTDFVRETVKVIKRRKYKYFRVHAMGEFYDAEYLKLWYDIARECKGVKFYAYSKNYDVVAACKDLKPDNFTMVQSVKTVMSNTYDLDVEGDKTPLDGFDSKAIIADMEIGGVNVCKAQGKPKGYCMGECTRCADKGQFVVLPLH